MANPAHIEKLKERIAYQMKNEEECKKWHQQEIEYRQGAINTYFNVLSMINKFLINEDK